MLCMIACIISVCVFLSDMDSVTFVGEPVTIALSLNNSKALFHFVIVIVNRVD